MTKSGKNFASRVSQIREAVKDYYGKVSLWFEDESRFGLMTRNGRMLTAEGVKPICAFQQRFESTWLYGAFSPSGEDFTLEFPVCDSDCFQVFLDSFAREHADEYPVMVLDNAAFHKAKKLKIPPNVCLMFQPPYSPEVNPAEKVWAKFKRAFTNKVFETIEAAKEFIADLVKTLEREQVRDICAFDYIKNEIGVI